MLRTLIVFACLVIIIGGIRAAAILVVPFLLALFLAILLTPVYFRLKRFHLPDHADEVRLICLLSGFYLLRDRAVSLLSLLKRLIRL